MATPMSFHDERSSDRDTHVSRSGKERPFIILSLIGSLFGALFSAVSTGDFISHLDRQVHSIHCSFLPVGNGELGESGCRTVMMSPYSSLLKTTIWGGLPISLLALAVFAYLVMKTAQLVLAREVTKRETLFLVAAAALPAAMSVIYAYIAISKLDAVCKLCVGVYLSSTAVLVGAVLAHVNAGHAAQRSPDMGLYVRWFLEGCIYVLVLAVFYVMFAPASDKSTAGCGTLVKKDDPSVLIPVGPQGRGTPALSVLDPLCPACKAFDERLNASNLATSLSMQMVLFPLDASCNWMVKDSLHPGACAVSEAMLCDKDKALEVLNFAFGRQEELRNMAKESDASVRKLLVEQFPRLQGCLGSAKVKNTLNKSLRFTVANALPVLTPQLFIGDKRVCDEDTDLGLEYTINSMLKR